MKVAMFPAYFEFCNDEMFNISSVYNKNNERYPYYLLKEKLAEAGTEMHTYDIGDIREYNKLLMINYNQNVANETGKYFSKEDRVLYIFEPPTVMPFMWSKESLDGYRNFFGKIFTYADNLVDNTVFFKFYNPAYPIPPEKEMEECYNNPRPFLLTFISTNHTSEYPGELYSFRNHMVKYFERTLEDFHVYGNYWNSGANHGFCTSKLHTLKNYKFCLAIENSAMNGYVTEKIFDAFYAGTIPVYLGAYNIIDYIPADTFIDFRDFSSVELLKDYLVNMDDSTISTYRKNIRNFLRSEKYYPFSSDCFVRSAASALGIPIG